jgi:hypothetical protein
MIDVKRDSESGAGNARGGTLEQGVGRQARARQRWLRVLCLPLGVRAVPPGHGCSLLPAVRAMGTTRTSYNRALFPTGVPVVLRLPSVLATSYGY